MRPLTSLLLIPTLFSALIMAKELPVERAVMTLGSQETFTLQKIKPCSNLIVRTEALQAVDTQGWISVEASSGCEAQAEIRVSVPYSAPSFGPMNIAIEEETADSKQVVSAVLLVLEVKAELVIELYGEDQDTVWNTPEQIYLQPHATPVTVKFVNIKNESDTGTQHRIHGEGAIKHSGSKDILKNQGDAYVFVVEDKGVVEARYRDHITYKSDKTKKILFNQVEIPSDASQLPGPFAPIR